MADGVAVEPEGWTTQGKENVRKGHRQVTPTNKFVSLHAASTEYGSLASAGSTREFNRLWFCLSALLLSQLQLLHRTGHEKSSTTGLR